MVFLSDGHDFDDIPCEGLSALGHDFESENVTVTSGVDYEFGGMGDFEFTCIACFERFETPFEFVLESVSEPRAKGGEAMG